MIEFFSNWLLEHGLSSSLTDLIAHGILIAIIILLGFIADIVAKKIILSALAKMVEKSKNTWDDIFLSNRVFTRLSHIAPAFLIYVFAPAFPAVTGLIQRLCIAYMILLGILIIESILEAIMDIYATFEISKTRPIKGYVQVVKIFIFVIGGVLIISTLMQRSPWILLSGLGALMAVILLVFKDSILGLVASVQLSSNDMVRIGDWIEAPKYGADGEVIDISLHTIKVQNGDKTITMIPAYALVSDSFKNSRGMKEAGGRRIKRNFYVDMASIKFCDAEMLERFSKIKYVADYINSKKAQMQDPSTNDFANMSNGLGITNVGIFRAYLIELLKNHPNINTELPFIVRHMPPTEHGLPLEVYAFTNDYVWANFENIQAEIFDHILATVPDFDLRVYQSPAGFDLKSLS